MKLLWRIYTNDDMLSSDFDSSKTNTDVKGSNSNDLQNVDHMYWPAVKLSRLPIGCNTKCYLQNQFQRFGHIERIICQPSMDAAYVAFDSLSSAQRAKRSGCESVLPGDGGLPSSVLLTMARIRCHPTSGSSSISPKLASNSSGSMKSHFTSIRPSGLKRPILSHLHSKPVLSKKHVSNLSASSSDQLAVTLSSTVTENLSSSSSPSSSSQLVYSTPPIISPISLSNTSTYNNSLFSQKSIFATTLDERLCLLQECYKRDCDLRSSSKSVDSNIQYSDVGNTDEPVHHAPIKGTCEDMCPELERYLRAVHQRVSIFECLPTTINSNSSSWEMDHTRAVKDYQRSSADQPVPLPRELRPTHVLQRTMAYLLASIADRPEIDTSRSLWKPWYEFMWTRTRAIPRFHIFCAARLVDQPVDSFDPRINSENLTQCLQTLKEMYSDLDSLNSSENLCPNEAEFRAYMLLMKLNDQNEINEAQRLPDCLRRSKPVRFAFATHEALITNNYIRFFRLARQATCLVACLMHRYFVQIRGQALMRLSCAFAGHPKREVHYPISTLTKQLGFENEEESRDFCERWGLTAKGSSVIFEKQVQPQPPELPWREKRSFQLIENKRISTRLSELFNGSPVNPSDAIPPPVKSSFGTNGVYIGSHDKNAEVNSNNTVTGGIYDSRVDENNNRYNSVKHPIISSSMFTSIQQTTVNPSTLMSSSTTRINIQNGERPMITDQLLEWIFEECVDEVIQFSKLAQTVLLESITIDELVEKLLIDVIKEHIVNVCFFSMLSFYCYHYVVL
ncbi:unnamed protein product [Heterobilharzia americana]|nr:unnamed protein product [Heterobilharzia americana]